MTKKIQSALISVFYKDGLETIVKQLHGLGIKLYSTGGTQKFIEQLISVWEKPVRATPLGKTSWAFGLYQTVGILSTYSKINAS